MGKVVGIPQMPDAWRQMLLTMEIDAHSPTEDFAELFSPPRAAVELRRYQFKASRSMDLLTGWDLLQDHVQELALREIHGRGNKVVGLSPPCTYFSKLMDTNWNRMDPEVAMHKLHEAVKMLDFAVWLAEWQMEKGRAFYLEHPQTAKSWSRPSLQQLAAKLRA